MTQCLTRRSLLAGAAATSLVARLPNALAASLMPPLGLTATPGGARLQGADGPETAIWGFNGSAPGPVIRVRQGEELVVAFSNKLPQASAVHWHGIRIDNRMDGVPGLTQPAVEPGGEFLYRFTPPDAGTFWYHPHERSFEQVPRGLTGALIVEEREPPQADQDLVLLINDWRLDSDGKLIETFGNRHDQVHAGRLGNWITVNGSPFAAFPVKRNERVRLRIINACSARILTLLLEGAAPKLIALDGQPVGPTTNYGDALVLGPANRVDLMLDITAAPGSRLVLTETSGERKELAELSVSAAPDKRPSPLIAPISLTANPLREPDRHDALVVPLVMTGGANNETDMSVMSGSGPAWQFNDMAPMTMSASGEPLFRVPRGRTVHVRFENRTAFAHAMHIHGHHFRLLTRYNGPEPQPFWWDTLLVQSGETSVVGFVADNPGRWMMHCHMLDHQFSGMDSWFEVLT